MVVGREGGGVGTGKVLMGPNYYFFLIGWSGSWAGFDWSSDGVRSLWQLQLLGQVLSRKILYKHTIP